MPFGRVWIRLFSPPSYNCRIFNSPYFKRFITIVDLFFSKLIDFLSTAFIYRTLHSYNLIWAICHLFPLQRWRTHIYSVSGNHWPGEPRDLRKTTSSRKFRPAFGIISKTRIFYKYVVFKHSLSFTQFLRSGNTLPSVWLNRRQIATAWMGLADINFFNIHWLWDFFQSQRNRLFRITKRKTF